MKGREHNVSKEFRQSQPLEEQDRGLFRVSPEENEQINAAVQLSGLTKQDYITKRLLCRDVVVQGNPKVYKALRDQLAAVLGELRRIEDSDGVNDELLDTINMIAAIMDGMKED